MSNNIYGIVLLIVGVFLLIVAILNYPRFFVISVLNSQKGVSNNYKRISTLITALFLLWGAYILFTEK